MSRKDQYKREQTVLLLGAKEPETRTVQEDSYMGVYGSVRIGRQTFYVRRVEDSLECSTWKEYRRVY